MVLSAQHLVGDFRRHVCGRGHVADDDDFAFGDHHPVLGPCVVGGPAPAPTQRFNLQHLSAVG